MVREAVDEATGQKKTYIRKNKTKAIERRQKRFVFYKPAAATRLGFELFFHHYAQQENRSLVLHSSPVPGQTYDFAVQGRGEDPLPAWVQPPLYTPV